MKGHSAVFVNEPRLSDFKQVLSKAGVQAEFSGGVLICNSIVAIRRVRTHTNLTYTNLVCYYSGCCVDSRLEVILSWKGLSVMNSIKSVTFCINSMPLFDDKLTYVVSYNLHEHHRH